MLDFFGFVVYEKGIVLPDSLTMLAMAGIDPGGPSEVEVERLKKRWKKGSVNTANTPLGAADPDPQPLGRSGGRATRSRPGRAPETGYA